MQKDSKTLFDEGFDHYKKGDLKNAAACFRAAGENGHQKSVGILLNIYESPEYDITPERFLGEIKHFANKGNFFAMIHLGRIRVGSYGTFEQHKPPFARYDFSKEVGPVTDDEIAWVDEAISGAEKKCTDNGIDSFEGLGMDYLKAADAYEKWQRLLHSEQQDNGMQVEAMEKACACIEQGTKWARKYLPNTQGPLNMFNEAAVNYKDKLDSLRRMKEEDEERGQTQYEVMRELFEKMQKELVPNDSVKQFLELMEKSQNLLNKHYPAKNQADIQMYTEAAKYAIEASRLVGVPDELIQSANEYIKNCQEIITSATVKIIAGDELERRERQKPVESSNPCRPKCRNTNETGVHVS